MAPCFGHTVVAFDTKNDRPGPGSLRGHFEAARGHFEFARGHFRVCPEWLAVPCMEWLPAFAHTGVIFDTKKDRPGHGSLRGHIEAARGGSLRLKALL